ncbi:hypothetical protein TNCV_4694431 [Trichonephila clavipes]|nr:hypothetical protein TNCV_4694431 [Trichonephila clavipes]
MWSLLLMKLFQERVHSKKPRILEKLRYETETASHAIPVVTLRDVTNNRRDKRHTEKMKRSEERRVRFGGRGRGMRHGKFESSQHSLQTEDQTK